MVRWRRGRSDGGSNNVANTASSPVFDHAVVTEHRRTEFLRITHCKQREAGAALGEFARVSHLTRRIPA